MLRALEANYDEIVRACFEDGDGVFPFGRARQILTSRSEGTFGYSDAYVMPSEVIHVVEVYLDGTASATLQAPWQLDLTDNQLLVDAGGREVALDYVKEGLEHTWSAGFALAVQRRLESVIKDVLEEVEESIARDQDAERQLMKASVKAAKNRSSAKVWKAGGGRLIRARRGRV